jgi:hypothetical protein
MIAVPRAVVALVGGQQGGAASGAYHRAKTLKGVGSQLFVCVPNPQVLEQLGVVGAAPALPVCAALAHRQGASDGLAARAEARGHWCVGSWLRAGCKAGGWGWGGACRGGGACVCVCVCVCVG